MESYDFRLNHEICKVADGKYQRFEGLTIICPLLSFSNWVTPFSLDGYLPLPPASFHMTLTNLWTRKHFLNAETYNEYNVLSETKLNLLKNVLGQMSGFSMNALSITSNNNCAKVVMTAGYEERVKMSHYQTIIRNILTPNIYSEPDIPHMTLGYATSNNVKHINVHLPVNTELHFGPPILCRFEDMTSFIPL